MSNRFSKLSDDQGQRPLVTLYEGWQDSVIDTSIWTVTNPATGTAWTSNTLNSTTLCCRTVPNNLEPAVISSVHRFQLPFVDGDFSTTINQVLRSLNLEFVIHLETNPANIDNTLSFFGLTPSAGQNKSDNDVVGWGVSPTTGTWEIIQRLGAAVANRATSFNEVFAAKHKLKMKFTAGDKIRYYIDGNMVFSSAFTGFLTASARYLTFYAYPSGGSAAVNLGVIRVWYEDEFIVG